MTSILVHIPRRFFQPSDIIDAHIVFDVTKEAKLRGLVCELYGRERATVHIGDNTYAETKTIVYHRQQVLGPGEVFPGRYEYDVRFQVPWNALPSFHATDANVTYSLRAHANIKWHLDARHVVDVTVVTGLPATNPLTPIIHTSKHFADEPEKPGMQIRIHDNSVPRGGVIQGVLRIKPGAKAEKLRGVEIEFYERILKRAHGKEQASKVYIFRTSIPFDDLTFKPEMPIAFQVPANIHPTFYGYCVRVYYYLEFNLDIAWGFDQEVMSEIVVL